MGSVVVGILLVALGALLVFEALALVAVAIATGRAGQGRPFGAESGWAAVLNAAGRVIEALGKLPLHSTLLLFGYGSIAGGCYLLAVQPF